MTWEDIKALIYAKLDLAPNDDEGGYLNYAERFVSYANEAMTMICSAVKPKRTFCSFDVKSIKSTDEDLVIGDVITMPDDFVSFGDDVNSIIEDIGYGTILKRETEDDDFDYLAYNQLSFNNPGKYKISYNARWYDFYDGDENIINVPRDVLECIATYVASQCMKVDDEQKAAMLRNEFEILLARIDDTNYKSNKTFKIGGDW